MVARNEDLGTEKTVRPVPLSDWEEYKPVLLTGSTERVYQISTRDGPGQSPAHRRPPCSIEIPSAPRTRVSARRREIANKLPARFRGWHGRKENPRADEQGQRRAGGEANDRASRPNRSSNWKFFVQPSRNQNAHRRRHRQDGTAVDRPIAKRRERKSPQHPQRQQPRPGIAPLTMVRDGQRQHAQAARHPEDDLQFDEERRRPGGFGGTVDQRDAKHGERGGQNHCSTSAISVRRRQSRGARTPPRPRNRR